MNNPLGTENEYGLLLALHGYKGCIIEVYVGQEDGATLCRILDLDGTEYPPVSADETNEAILLAHDFISTLPDYGHIDPRRDAYDDTTFSDRYSRQEL